VTVVGGGAPVPTTVVQPRPLPAGGVTHAIQIAEAMRAAGIGCETAEVEPGPPATTPVDPKEEVSCDVGDDTVAIRMFADHAALVAATGTTLRQGICFVAKNQATNLTYAEGDNWIVFPQQKATAARISAALHAALETVRCE
jgi:hypothetical protein